MAQGKRDRDYSSAVGTKAGEDKTKKEADFFSKPYLIIQDFTELYCILIDLKRERSETTAV